MNASRAKKYILALSFCYMVISFVYLFFGTFHLDEGAYLYAANMFYQGKLPYRDFFFLQPPLYPIVFGLVQIIFPGFLTCRLTSILFGAISTGILLLTIKKREDSRAAVITLALITSNLFQLYFFSITRLYALTTFFLSCGFYFLTAYKGNKSHGYLFAMLSFACGVATRLTTLPLLFIAAIYVLVNEKRLSSRILILSAPVIFLCIVFGYFLYQCGIDVLWFNLLGMNLSLHSHNLAANILQKLRATSQFIRFYFLVLVLFTPLVPGFFRNISGNSFHTTWKKLWSPKGVLWTMAIVMLAVHTTAKIYQVSYQTIIMPLFMGLVAIEWSAFMKKSPENVRRFLALSFVIACGISILSYGRTSIRLIDGKSGYQILKEQARFIAENSAPGDKIFTADSALAPIEAGRDVLTGMAGSDLFPGWSTERCRKFKVLNFEIMEDYIRQRQAPVLIIEDHSFTLALPYLEPISKHRKEKLLQLIDSYYVLKKKVPNLLIPDSFTYLYIAGSKQ